MDQQKLHYTNVLPLSYGNLNIDMAILASPNIA